MWNSPIRTIRPVPAASPPYHHRLTPSGSGSGSQKREPGGRRTQEEAICYPSSVRSAERLQMASELSAVSFEQSAKGSPTPGDGVCIRSRSRKRRMPGWERRHQKQARHRVGCADTRRNGHRSGRVKRGAVSAGCCLDMATRWPWWSAASPYCPCGRGSKSA